MKFGTAPVEEVNALEGQLDSTPEPEHRSIGKVAEPNCMGDCEACGQPWPCADATPDLGLT